jgi:hypothetical protein
MIPYARGCTGLRGLSEVAWESRCSRKGVAIGISNALLVLRVLILISSLSKSIWLQVRLARSLKRWPVYSIRLTNRTADHVAGLRRLVADRPGGGREGALVYRDLGLPTQSRPLPHPSATLHRPLPITPNAPSYPPSMSWSSFP